MNIDNDFVKSTKFRKNNNGDIDDLLQQICSKLGGLETNDSHEEMVTAFVSVLYCSIEEANFFLDSAGKYIS